MVLFSRFYPCSVVRCANLREPLFMDFKIYRDDKPVPDEETKVQIGSTNYGTFSNL